MNYIIIIKAVLALLPTIIEAVKAIEAAFPQSGQGHAKIEAVRTIVEAAYGVAADAALKFDSLWPAIQSAVSAVVSLANSTGLFKK